MYLSRRTTLRESGPVNVTSWRRSPSLIPMSCIALANPLGSAALLNLRYSTTAVVAELVRHTAVHIAQL